MVCVKMYITKNIKADEAYQVQAPKLINKVEAFSPYKNCFRLFGVDVDLNSIVEHPNSSFI